MQDRYAGDIGDYGKFGMLRALASNGLSIGVNWYLVETPPQELSVNDGGKLIPEGLASCDPGLAKALQDISRSPQRSARLLEEASLVPGARYYSSVVPVEGRDAWHARAISELAGPDLVFLDPDNGLLVKSVGKRSARSPKYALYEEVADYVARGQSVVVYNHRSRKKQDVYFGEICERLADAVPQSSDVTAITFPKGSVRDYFAISASPEHARLIRKTFDELTNGAWGTLGLCRLESLPVLPHRQTVASSYLQESNKREDGMSVSEHLAKMIDRIERTGFKGEESFGDEIGHVLYSEELTDRTYRKTLDYYGLEGARPWGADIESRDLKATIALFTFVHRADHFAEGAMRQCLENGFVYRILRRLREIDGGSVRPVQLGFWKEDDPLGCCSNWYPAGFDFRGTRFATGEHWMMWQKARLMGDLDKAGQILAAQTPREAKKLGGEVKPYDGALWDAVREQMVYYGVREKFLANELERNLLLSTGTALLAEASPYDRVWGVGMTADDPRFANPAKWEGENLLGRACMRARADIRQICALGKLGVVRYGRPRLNPVVSRMTLLQLSRMPAARAAVYCYATIVSHALPAKYPSAGAFLKREHDATVESITQSMEAGASGLPVTGWYELVRELEIQQVLGRL